MVKFEWVMSSVNCSIYKPWINPCSLIPISLLLPSSTFNFSESRSIQGKNSSSAFLGRFFLLLGYDLFSLFVIMVSSKLSFNCHTSFLLLNVSVIFSVLLKKNVSWWFTFIFFLVVCLIYIVTIFIHFYHFNWVLYERRDSMYTVSNQTHLYSLT